MKQHNSIFGDATTDEIKAKLKARREAKEAEKAQPEKVEPGNPNGPANTDATG